MDSTGAVLGIFLVILGAAISIAVSETKKSIATSCEVTQTFVIDGKGYKCEELK